MTTRRKAAARKPDGSAEPLYREIRAVLEAARSGAYRAVNAAMVQAYWNVGRLIVEHEQKGRHRAGYGDALIATVAKRLTRELGRGFDERNLWYMRRFHLAFPILNALRSELTVAAKRNATASELAIHHAMRDESPTENLQAFLLELGKGFSFVARQKRLRFEEEDFYVVFYNYLLKCFVLIDLKVGKLTHQDIGQMDSYVRMFDEHARPEGDNPTISLILCSRKNEAIAKYSVLREARQIFAAKYVKVLPTERELTREIERERRLIDARQAERERPR